MPPASSLRDLLAPIALEDFVRDHFEGAPLHLRGARDRFRGLFSSDDFLAMARARPLPGLSASPPDPDGDVFRALGKRPTMRVEPRDVDVVLASGATLMLDDLHRI